MSLYLLTYSYKTTSIMKKLLSITFLLLVNIMYSQVPDWSVNSSSYQYSMTITSVLNVNGVTLTNANDKIGAFVNNQARGEANVVYNTNADKYVAYLTVYANTQGEAITFKIYDSQNNATIIPTQTQTFVIDGNIGGVFQSFSVAEPPLNSTAEISSFSFQGIAETATISDRDITIEIPSNSSLTSLTPIFTTENNGKVYLNKVRQTSGNTTVDFTNPVNYEVLSEDEAVKKDYTVTVTKKAQSNPPTIVLSSSNILSNVQPAVVTLTASDPITGLTPDDFSVQNATVSKITLQTTTTFELELIALSEGSFSLELPNNKVVNGNNQGNLRSNKLTFTLDSKKPFIKSITRKTPANEFTSGTSVVFEVTFSEEVKNVKGTDFTSVANSVINVSKVNNTTYHITISNLVNYSGGVSLGVSSSAAITDTAGNLLQPSKIVSYEK